MLVSLLINVLFTVICFCSGDELIELNRDLDPNHSYEYFPSEKFRLETVHDGYAKEGYWYTHYKFCGSEHLGTHLDAPIHFAKDKWTVDEIPIDRLFAPVVVIDIREKVSKNNIYQLTANDIVKWNEANGAFPNNSVVLINTGWDKRYNDRKSYYGHATDVKKYQFPGVSLGAATALIGLKASSGIQIVGVGIDTPSIDFGPSQDYVSHQEFATANIYGLESLKDLHKVPVVGAELIVMPMKIKGGSGAPARVVARIPMGNRSEVVTCSLILIVTCIFFISYLSKM